MALGPGWFPHLTLTRASRLGLILTSIRYSVSTMHVVGHGYEDALLHFNERLPEIGLR